MKTAIFLNNKLMVEDKKLMEKINKLITQVSKYSKKQKQAIEKLLNNEVVVTIAMNIQPINKE